MELSSFSENIVTETFERSGETLELKINRDALVPDYFDVMTERLKPTIEQLERLMETHAKLQQEIEEVEESTKEPTTKKGKSKKKPKPIDLGAMTIRMREIQKGIAEINREVYAERLTCPIKLPDGSTTCLLKDWDMTHKGDPIPASKENLLRLPAAAIEALFDFVMSKTETVKKKEESETGETSDAVPNGSPALRVVGQSS